MSNKENSFHHEVEGPIKPWTRMPEYQDGDFNFAIISDLTGGERKRIFEVAVAQVNRFDTDFVLSVGDLIEGGSRDAMQLKKEWDDFDRRAALLQAPFFYLGGNHDLTNKVMQEFWKERYGPTYYHFIYNKVLFLMLDSEDFEPGKLEEIDKARAEAMKMLRGEIDGDFETSAYVTMPESRTGGMSREQFQYFQEVLNKHKDVDWIFVFMHKPLWKNEDLTAWLDLEGLLGGKNYTVINGHLHSMSHENRKKADHIMLGTTGGYQNALDSMAFDHITLVKVEKGRPVITHLKMEGILDETGHVPLSGDSLSFSAFREKAKG